MPVIRNDFHLSLNPLSRSKGAHAVHAAAYRSGERLADADGVVYDYTRRARGREIGGTAIVTPAAFSWPATAGRQALWQSAEAAEKRVNSVIAYEIDVALPRELTRKKQMAMLIEIARDIAETHGVVVDVSLHEPPTKAGDDEARESPPGGGVGDDEARENPHGHLLISSRELTHDGFGAKVRDFSDNRDLGPATILHWRQRWETIENEALAAAEVQSRVTRLSHKDRGLDLEPTRHEGRRARYGQKRGLDSEIVAHNQGVRERNARRKAAPGSVPQIRAKIELLKAEIAAAEADRAAEQAAEQEVRQRLQKLRDKPSPAPRRPVAAPALVAAIAPADAKVRAMWLEARVQMRLQRYPLAAAEDIENLARYWRDRRLPDGSWEYSNRAGRLVDAGDEIRADVGNELEVGAMIQIAVAKRWKAIQFDGSDDFKSRAMRAALIAGIKVTPKTDRDFEILAGVRAELPVSAAGSRKGEAPPKVQ
jgi:hypothetical protein